MNLLDSPHLKSFLNHRGLNPVDVNSLRDETNFRKVFRKDFFKWLDSRVAIASHQKSAIGMFIESHLTDEFLIEADSIQLAGGNGFQLVLDEYKERWGRVITH